MGYLDSLGRRYATLDDIKITNVLFANRDARAAMNTASLFSKMGILKVKNIIRPTILLLGLIVFLTVMFLASIGKLRKVGAAWNL